MTFFRKIFGIAKIIGFTILLLLSVFSYNLFVILDLDESPEILIELLEFSEKFYLILFITLVLSALELFLRISEEVGSFINAIKTTEGLISLFVLIDGILIYFVIGKVSSLNKELFLNISIGGIIATLFYLLFALRYKDTNKTFFILFIVCFVLQNISIVGTIDGFIKNWEVKQVLIKINCGIQIIKDLICFGVCILASVRDLLSSDI